MLGIIIGIGAWWCLIAVVGDAAKDGTAISALWAIQHDWIFAIQSKDFGDDNPQYRQALKYDDLVVSLQKQPWVNSATRPAFQRACLSLWQY